LVLELAGSITLCPIMINLPGEFAQMLARGELPSLSAPFCITAVGRGTERVMA
jgi:hypothetical protein